MPLFLLLLTKIKSEHFSEPISLISTFWKSDGMELLYCSTVVRLRVKQPLKVFCRQTTVKGVLQTE